MPTVLRHGPYRLFFYAADRNEPEHVHVERDNRVARFWLDPRQTPESAGLQRAEILRIERMIGTRPRTAPRSSGSTGPRTAAPSTAIPNFGENPQFWGRTQAGQRHKLRLPDLSRNQVTLLAADHRPIRRRA